MKKLIIPAFLIGFILSGCCFGEKVIQPTITLDYKEFTTDTAYIQLYCKNGVCSPYGGSAFQADSKKIDIKLDRILKIDTAYFKIILSPSGHEDIINNAGYRLQGQCHDKITDESLFINGVEQHGTTLVVKK